MKRCVLFVAALMLFSVANGQIKRLKKETDKRFNFYILNDVGRNGHYEQKDFANTLGEVAEEVDIEFVAALGDIHHYDGVRSVHDPLWMSNFENIYSHPELMMDWFPVLGNHEYRGNTQAVMDYRNISRRWSTNGRYYTQLHKIKGGGTLRLVYIDTAPLIDKYHKEFETYPDVREQDMNKQIQWIDSVLTNNNATWTVVMGHHPIKAQTTKSAAERENLQERVAPILRKHNVDFYICGHIHNFQHITEKESDLNYVVNSAASLSRKVSAIEGTQFCNGNTGFSIFSANQNSAKVIMVGKKGKVLYVAEKKK
ncbi:MAG: metallophosphoesterase [Marinifilaceae bacterium]